MEQRLDQRIDGLEQRTDLKLQGLEHRVLSTFHRELVTQTRLYVVAMVGSLDTVAGLAFAAARLI
ncbi:MAG TPA: hypothetical protein VG452_03630 [Egibacteraceae bacterium]|nr:hypothetical protein [Egibacteraceae bacterium]